MVLDRKNVFLLIAILESFSGTAWTLKTYGVQDLCGTVLELRSLDYGVESSAIVKPKENGPYMDGVQDCTLVVKRPWSIHKLVVSFRTRDLRPSGKDVLMIDFQNGVQKKYTSDNNIDDPDSTEWGMTSKDVLITFSTASGGPSTSNYKGFEIIVTLGEGEPCERDHFRCNTGDMCISNKLKCDGYNHCGDRSDQQYCFGVSTTSTTDIITSIIDITTNTVDSTTSTVDSTRTTTDSTTSSIDSTTSTTCGTTSTNHDTRLVLWLAIGGIAFLSACFY